MRGSALATASTGLLPRGQLLGDEKRGDFAVGLRFELIAFAGQFLAQRFEIFYYSIVHNRNFVAGVRMGVGFVGLAVRRPSRMADADRTRQRRRGEAPLQIAQFALGAPARQTPRLQRGDSRRIIAAIFEPLQRLDNLPRDGTGPENANDAAHEDILERTPNRNESKG